jgi:hypothetical protein
MSRTSDSRNDLKKVINSKVADQAHESYCGAGQAYDCFGVELFTGKVASGLVGADQ